MNFEKIGLALFIDSENGNDGVGLVGTKNSKKIKISSFRKLDENVIWITNIKNNQSLPSNVKSNEYLNYDLEKLIYKLGLNTSSRLKITKELHTIIINLLTRVYHTKKYTFDEFKSSMFLYDLNGDISKNNNFFKINGFFKKTKSKTFITKLTKIKNEKDLCLFEKNDNVLESISECSVPIGKWKKINQKTLVNKDIDWFLSLQKKHHFVIEANIKIINNELNFLIPNKMYSGKSLITDVELGLIHKFSDIKITNLYINDKKENIKSLFNTEIFKSIDYQKGSVTSDLLSNSNIELIKSKNFGDINYWLDTYEQISLLKKCLVLLNYEIKVLGYGNGNILISYLKSENEQKILNISNKLKLLYPVNIHH